MKIFSRQKTYKNTEFKDACASFSFIYSVSKICLNVVNFPAKRLNSNNKKKYGAQNTHAPIFLKYNLHCQ